ncbi:MAG: cytochrome P450 [Bacteroidota bacterium]
MQKDIPYYEGKGFLGLPKDFAKNVAQFAHEQEVTLGDFYRIRFLLFPIYIVFRPSVIQHILQTNAKNYRKSPAYNQLKLALGNGLVTSEGAFWKRQRKMAQPAFYKTRLEQLFVEMTDVVDHYVQHLERQIAVEAVVNISRAMVQVTSDIVMRTLFSSRNNANQDQMYQMMSEIQEYVTFRVHHPFQIPLQYLNGRHQKFKKQRSDFSVSVFQLIEERRAMKERPSDLLSLLLEAEDVETGERMTDQELRDEVITLFSAGHETSANAMAWTLDLLAQHPTVINKLRAEEKSVLDGRTPSFSDLRQLRYHQQVIEEGMRLYPPAHAIGRQAIAEDEIGGVLVPKKSAFFISVYALHRSPRYWEAPEAFRPERFETEKVKKRQKFTYLPFGGGQRMCIGNHFAMMEMQLLLAKLVRHFDFERLSNETVPFQPLITLKPKEDIRLRVSRHSEVMV